MTRRKRTVRRRMIAGPNGDLFIASAGTEATVILDGDLAYPDKMSARAAWFACREMTWSHPDRPPCEPPYAAEYYDGFVCTVRRYLPDWNPYPASRWDPKALAAAVKVDVKFAETWQKTNVPLAGIDIYVRELQDVAAALAGMTDEAAAARRKAALFAGCA